MWTDYQLSNFSRYLKETPKTLLGVYPITPQGAYDALSGGRGHGFGHRRGIPSRAFSRGGAFDAPGGEYGANGANGENADLPKSGQAWKKLEALLSPILSTEEMVEAGQLIEELVDHCKTEAKNDATEDDDPDAEAEDRRRAARDNPEPFSGMPRTGGTMVGRAGDARPRRPVAADLKHVASFNALFNNPVPVKHV